MISHPVSQTEVDGFGGIGVGGRPLLERLGCPTELVTIGRPTEWRASETVSSGFPGLDRLLPAGGIRRGSLLEWWATGGADGAVAVACAVACRLAESRSRERSSGGLLSGDTGAASTIVVVDRGGRFYPPAVLPWLASLPIAASGGTETGGQGGVPEIVMVRPSRDDDELWAIDQSLRCPGVAAVLAWPGRMQANAMRRLQLAARASGAVGLWVRGLGDARTQASRAPMNEPTWADARVMVTPLPPVGGKSLPCPAERRLRLSLVGGPWQGEAMLEDRSVEICLDLASGREAVGCQGAGGRSVRSLPGREGRACRAS
jgi:hypothetical protein